MLRLDAAQLAAGSDHEVRSRTPLVQVLVYALGRSLTGTLHVVRPDGRVYAGAEAVARSIMLIPVAGWFALLYYVPGVRQLAEIGYRIVAKNRYRIAGRTEECDGGTCSLHE